MDQTSPHDTAPHDMPARPDLEGGSSGDVGHHGDVVRLLDGFDAHNDFGVGHHVPNAQAGKACPLQSHTQHTTEDTAVATQRQGRGDARPARALGTILNRDEPWRAAMPGR